MVSPGAHNQPWSIEAFCGSPSQVHGCLLTFTFITKRRNPTRTHSHAHSYAFAKLPRTNSSSLSTFTDWTATLILLTNFSNLLLVHDFWPELKFPSHRLTPNSNLSNAFFIAVLVQKPFGCPLPSTKPCFFQTWISTYLFLLISTFVLFIALQQ